MEKVILILGWWVIGLQGVHAEGIVTVRLAEVRTESDSLVVEMLLDFGRTKAGPGKAFLFTPVLRGADRWLELPAMVVSGTRRDRADRRKQVLQPEEGYVKPYRVLRNKDRQDSVAYRVAVAYSPWQEHAALMLMREGRDCCRMKIYGVEKIMADIAVEGAFAMPVPDIHRQGRQSGQEERRQKKHSQYVPCAECTAMVSYLTPDTETEKLRSDATTLYIDYPNGVYDVRREYRRNAVELAHLDSLLSPLLQGDFVRISGVRVCGYASPEGAYQSNEMLASNRAAHFEAYMRRAYGLAHDLFRVSSVAEDWEGLKELLHADHAPYADKVLALIDSVSIFAGREKKLMLLDGGNVYHNLLTDYFPRLRRIRVTVGYRARAFNIEEAARLIYTHPRLLSLQEMYRVAAFYRPGTEQYREIYEIAAFHFPDDAVANINAASAVIMAGDPVTAYQYLNKVADDPRAWNDFGVLAYLEGNMEAAAKWFRKALGVEPQKARKNLKKILDEE